MTSIINIIIIHEFGPYMGAEKSHTRCAVFSLTTLYNERAHRRMHVREMRTSGIVQITLRYVQRPTVK